MADGNSGLFSTVGNIASSLFGGMASIFAQNSANTTNKSINRQNIELQRETNEMNERLWREQFEEAKRQYYNTLKYNSEEAQKAFEREADWNSPVNQMALLRKAGINPFSVFGQNANVAAIHSSPASGANGNIPSAPQMIAPNLTWQNSSLAANLQLVDTVVNAIDKLSSSSLRKSQKREIETLLKGKLEQLIADTENKDAQAALVRLQTDFEQTFGYLMRDKQLEKYAAEISNLYEDTALKISQGEYIDEQKLTEETKRIVNNASAYMNNQQARIFEHQANTFMIRFNQDIKESNSRVTANYAGAESSRAASHQYEITANRLEALLPNEVNLQELEKEVREGDPRSILKRIIGKIKGSQQEFEAAYWHWIYEGHHGSINDYKGKSGGVR